MRFGSSALKLMVAREREDVIAHNIRFAVMLMKASVSRAIDDIVFGEDAAAAFIKINSPPAVANTGNIVPEIVSDDRPGLIAKGVNATHVAQGWTITV